MTEIAKALMLDETGKEIVAAIKAFGAPSDAQVEATMGKWLDEHPDAAATMPDELLEALPSEMREVIDAAYDAGLEQGAVDPVSGLVTNSDKRVRTDYIPVGHNIIGTFKENSTQQFVMRVFDKDKSFMGIAFVDANGTWSTRSSWNTGVPCDIDGVKSVYPTAKYIRFVFAKSDTELVILPSEVEMIFTYPTLGSLNGITLDEVYGHTTKKQYQENNIRLSYTIDDEGHYTKGYLKLPPNYSPTGAPVPLIVFSPASNCFTGIDKEMVVDYYEGYYNYLRDCGYAIFSCYGWGNVYTQSACGTFGTPTNNKCWQKGIKYVCEQYNIDAENVFVTTKSLGGIQALALCYQNEVKIKACGLLAPELDTLAQFHTARPTRMLVATDLGFTGDWQSVLDVENDAYDRTAAANYLRTQADILASANPMYKSLLLPTETKLTCSFNRNGFDMSAFRLSSVPIKIWIASDDTAVSYPQAQYLIATLRNAGCDGELRTMPAGTGQHGAVDRGENALQTTDVTTRLGIHYDAIPTAYYELEQYFAEFAYKP